MVTEQEKNTGVYMVSKLVGAPDTLDKITIKDKI
jgi:hypothetical protein